MTQPTYNGPFGAAAAAVNDTYDQLRKDRQYQDQLALQKEQLSLQKAQRRDQNIKDMLARSDTLQSWLDTNGKYLDPEYLTAMSNYVGAMQSTGLAWQASDDDKPLLDFQNQYGPGKAWGTDALNHPIGWGEIRANAYKNKPQKDLEEKFSVALGDSAAKFLGSVIADHADDPRVQDLAKSLLARAAKGEPIDLASALGTAMATAGVTPESLLLKYQKDPSIQNLAAIQKAFATLGDKVPDSEAKRQLDSIIAERKGEIDDYWAGERAKVQAPVYANSYAAQQIRQLTQSNNVDEATAATRIEREFVITEGQKIGNRQGEVNIDMTLANLYKLRQDTQFAAEDHPLQHQILERTIAQMEAQTENIAFSTTRLQTLLQGEVELNAANVASLNAGTNRTNALLPGEVKLQGMTLDQMQQQLDEARAGQNDRLAGLKADVETKIEQLNEMKDLAPTKKAAMLAELKKAQIEIDFLERTQDSRVTVENGKVDLLNQQLQRGDIDIASAALDLDEKTQTSVSRVESEIATAQAGTSTANLARAKATAAMELVGLETADQRAGFLYHIAQMGDAGKSILEGLKGQGLIDPKTFSTFSATADLYQRKATAETITVEATAQQTKGEAEYTTQTLQTAIGAANAKNTFEEKQAIYNQGFMAMDSMAKKAMYLDGLAKMGDAGVPIIQAMVKAGLISSTTATGFINNAREYQGQLSATTATMHWQAVGAEGTAASQVAQGKVDTRLVDTNVLMGKATLAQVQETVAGIRIENRFQNTTFEDRVNGVRLTVQGQEVQVAYDTRTLENRISMVESQKKDMELDVRFKNDTFAMRIKELADKNRYQELLNIGAQLANGEQMAKNSFAYQYWKYTVAGLKAQYQKTLADMDPKNAGTSKERMQNLVTLRQINQAEVKSAEDDFERLFKAYVPNAKLVGNKYDITQFQIQSADLLKSGAISQSQLDQLNAAAGVVNEKRLERTALSQQVQQLLGFDLGNNGSGTPGMAVDLTPKGKVQSAGWSDEARDAVASGAAALGVDPNYLAAVISFETAGTFDPKKPTGNGKDGKPLSSAKGLVQFTDGTARSLGYKDAADLVAKNPTIKQQMNEVVRYFQAWGLKPGATVADMYKVVFAPGVKGDVLYTKDTDGYKKQPQRDLDNNGEITIQEMATAIQRGGHLTQYFPTHYGPAEETDYPDVPGSGGSSVRSTEQPKTTTPATNTAAGSKTPAAPAKPGGTTKAPAQAPANPGNNSLARGTANPSAGGVIAGRNAAPAAVQNPNAGRSAATNTAKPATSSKAPAPAAAAPNPAAQTQVPYAPGKAPGQQAAIQIPGAPVVPGLAPAATGAISNQNGINLNPAQNPAAVNRMAPAPAKTAAGIPVSAQGPAKKPIATYTAKDGSAYTSKLIPQPTLDKMGERGVFTSAQQVATAQYSNDTEHAMAMENWLMDTVDNWATGLWGNNATPQNRARLYQEMAVMLGWWR